MADLRLLEAESDPIRELEVRVPGKPRGKGRPRHSSHTRNDGTRYVVTRSDDTTVSFENLVALAAADALGDGPPFSPKAAVLIRVMAVFPRPKRLIPRYLGGNGPASTPRGRLPYTSKPDANNVLGAILDGLTQAGVWRDDAQVDIDGVRRRYVALGELPHTLIQLEAL